MITIRNTTTGETKQVNESDLPNYGLQGQGSQQQPNQPGLLPGLTPDAPNNVPAFKPDPMQQPQGTNLGPLNGIMDFFAPGMRTGMQQSVQSQQRDVPKSMGEALNPMTQIGNFARDVVQPMVKPAVGLASWLSPLKSESMVARGLLGAGQGAENAYANNSNMLTGALAGGGLNMAMPGLQNTASSMLGRTALGKGGEALPKIVRESGNAISGSAEKIKNNIYDLTQPIRDKLAKLLNNGKTISAAEVFGEKPNILGDINGMVGGKMDTAGSTVVGNRTMPQIVNNSGISADMKKTLMQKMKSGKATATEKEMYQKAQQFSGTEIPGATQTTTPDPTTSAPIFNQTWGQKGGGNKGILGHLADNLGHTQKGEGQDYINTLKSAYLDKAMEHLRQAGVPSDQIPNMLQNDKLALPLTFWSDFLHGVGKDLGSKWEKIQTGKPVDAMGQIGSGLYGQLQNIIKERSSDPKAADRLLGLLKSSHDISSSIGKSQAGKGGLTSTLKSAGIPLEVIGTLLSGHPMLAAGGAAAGAASNPRIATPIASALASKNGDAVMQALQRLGIGGLNSMGSDQGSSQMQ